jgi:tRNA threonylcarbamoyl adenosine modification protein (Sua5/YciO/YrdC/YwlC family)
MKTVNLPDVLKSKKARREMIVGMIEGKVFLYPTDTIYGLGCDATNYAAVNRIRTIKTSIHPFSVIAPSKGWILENMVVKHPSYLDKLPGPYTFVFKMKRPIVSPRVSIRTLGIRIPEHPFVDLIQESSVPFVSTSANMSGEVPVWTTFGIPEGIERNVDFAVHDDILNKPPSQVIDLTGQRPRLLRS